MDCGKKLWTMDWRCSQRTHNKILNNEAQNEYEEMATRCFTPWIRRNLTLDARGFSLLERRNTAKRREKPLVQTVEFCKNAGPMRHRFIFPESDFDPSNSICPRNLSVLTSTLIGLATESSSNRFLISLSTLFPVATGHNRNAAAKSRKSGF